MKHLMRHFAMPVRSWAVSAPRSIAAVAVLALGLTACGGDDEGTSATSTPSASGSVTASAEASPADGSTAEGAAAEEAPAEGSATGGGSSDKSGGSSDKSGGSAAGAAAKAAPCSTGSLSLTVEHIDERTHELIAVTNKGDKACTVLNAPMVSFDDLDGGALIMENTAPKAVVTLDSGATAYAALVLDTTGSAESDGKAVNTLNIELEGTESGKLSAKLPGAPVKAYEAEVTCWQPSMNDLATIGY